jgi:hypothetical protein
MRRDESQRNLSDYVELQVGSLVQVFGELQQVLFWFLFFVNLLTSLQRSDHKVIQARIVQDVSGMDMHLWREAVILLRKYLVSSS